MVSCNNMNAKQKFDFWEDKKVFCLNSLQLEQ